MIEKDLVTKIKHSEDEYDVDFLQLNLLHLQNVVFWWQNLSQSCGRFSTTTSSSKGSILVTRSLSILWQIFFSYILFNWFYFEVWVFEFISNMFVESDDFKKFIFMFQIFRCSLRFIIFNNTLVWAKDCSKAKWPFWWVPKGDGQGNGSSITR